jgi:Protein of Unknown function (DUF2784)
VWYNVAADLVVVVHFAFICFVVGGVYLAWRWAWVVWLHIPAIIYAISIELIGFACPLTALQNWLLHRAGQAGYSGGFIYHYLIRVIYPPGLTRTEQVGLGFLVAIIAAVGYRGYLRRYRPGWAWWPEPNSHGASAAPRTDETAGSRSGGGQGSPAA